MSKNIPFMDLSEYTLPRNLEFKINKIEDGFVSPDQVIQFSRNRNKNKKNMSSFTKLNKLLKKKGIFNSTNEASGDTEDDIIEKEIFPKIKIYYCSFTKWHPREQLMYDTMMKDAKYVLDENALSTWNDNW